MKNAFFKREFLRLTSGILAFFMTAQSVCYADKGDRSVNGRSIGHHLDSSLLYFTDVEVSGEDAEKTGVGVPGDVFGAYMDAREHLFAEMEAAKKQNPEYGLAEIRSKMRDGNYYYPNRVGNKDNPEPEFEVKMIPVEFNDTKFVIAKVTARRDGYKIPYLFTPEFELSDRETISDILFGYHEGKQYVNSLILNGAQRVKRIQISNAPRLDTDEVQDPFSIKVVDSEEILRDLQKWSEWWPVFLRAVIQPAKLVDVVVAAPIFASVSFALNVVLAHARGMNPEYWTIGALSIFGVFIGPAIKTIKRIIGLNPQKKFVRELPISGAFTAVGALTHGIAYPEPVSEDATLMDAALSLSSFTLDTWLQRMSGSSSDRLLTIKYALKHYQGENEFLRIFGFNTGIDKYQFHQRVLGIVSSPIKNLPFMAGQYQGWVKYFMKYVPLIIMGLAGLGAAYVYTKLIKADLKKKLETATGEKRSKILDDIARIEENEPDVVRDFKSFFVLYLNQVFPKTTAAVKRFFGGCRNVAFKTIENFITRSPGESQ